MPTHQQIMVSIVTPEQEDQSGPRGAAAGGVAYLSLTEHVPNEAPVRTLGTLGKPGTFCDHECRPREELRGRDDAGEVAGAAGQIAGALGAPG